MLKTLLPLSQKLMLTMLLLVAVGISSWLLANAKHSIHHLDNPYLLSSFASDVSIAYYTDSGYLSEQFFTARLEHYPKLNKIQAVSPRLTLYEENSTQPAWQVTAQQANADTNLKLIHLLEGVQGIHHMPANRDPLTFRTTQLTLDVKAKYAHTDQVVHIMQPGAYLTATGADINLKTHSIKLLSQVSGQYQNQF